MWKTIKQEKRQKRLEQLAWLLVGVCLVALALVLIKIADTRGNMQEVEPTVFDKILTGDK